MGGGGRAGGLLERDGQLGIDFKVRLGLGLGSGWGWEGGRGAVMGRDGCHWVYHT